MVGAVLSQLVNNREAGQTPPSLDKENKSKRYNVVAYSPTSCTQPIES
jgi:hypothetical protein